MGTNRVTMTAWRPAGSRSMVAVGLANALLPPWGTLLAPPVGRDVESLGGPARPVVQVHPPAAKVAAAALGLHQVIVPAPVAQVVTVADVAADLLARRRGGPLGCL